MTKPLAFIERLQALMGFASSAAPASSKTQTDALWPTDIAGFAPADDEEDKLIKLDHSYAGMYRLHHHCHEGIAVEIAAMMNDHTARRFLEVAPGTGWITRLFIDVLPEYWAIEISEFAVKVLLRRFPKAHIINCEIEQADVVADDAFDVVFCASMLEHIGDHETALKHLIRLARTDLFVVFYEGLGADEEEIFRHFPYDNQDWRQWHGMKFLAYQDRHHGFFMKRYARSTIDKIVEAAGAEASYLDSSNRQYLKNETILHVRKPR